MNNQYDKNIDVVFYIIDQISKNYKNKDYVSPKILYKLLFLIDFYLYKDIRVPVSNNYYLKLPYHGITPVQLKTLINICQGKEDQYEKYLGNGGKNNEMKKIKNKFKEKLKFVNNNLTKIKINSNKVSVKTLATHEKKIIKKIIKSEIGATAINDINKLSDLINKEPIYKNTKYGEMIGLDGAFDLNLI